MIPWNIKNERTITAKKKIKRITFHILRIKSKYTFFWLKNILKVEFLNTLKQKYDRIRNMRIFILSVQFNRINTLFQITSKGEEGM